MPRRATDLLDHWRDHGTISAADHAMGARIRSVWEASEMQGLACIRLDRPTPQTSFDTAGHQDRVIDCRQALERMRWYLGEIDQHLVLQVVALGSSLQDVGLAWSFIGGQQHVGRRVRLALRWLVSKRWGLRDEAIEVAPGSRRT